MSNRLDDLELIDYCDLSDREGYIEASVMQDDVDEAMINPIISILVEDASNPDLLFEYQLVRLIDAETNDVVAVVNFEEDEDGYTTH